MDKKKRKRLFQEEAVLLGFTPKPNQPGRNQARYSITHKQWLKVLEHRFKQDDRRFVEKIQKIDRHGEVTSTIQKLEAPQTPVPDNFQIIKISQSPTTGQEWVQYAPAEQGGISEDFLEEVIQKYSVSLYDKEITIENPITEFDTLTFTDVHIGMDTDKYDNTMYQNEWNGDILMQDCTKLVEQTLSNKQSEVLVIDDLGDFLDGFDGKTTRKGHDLPQNMTNEEAFDYGIRFKTYLLDNLSNYYDKIIVNNICNDNHAGSFGYFVNSAVEKISKSRYKNIEVTNHRKFINHYFVGDTCFLITHGKDDKALRFGFGVYPKAQEIEKIDQYCKHYDIYKKAKRIIFKKGDSHQMLFDFCSSDDFYYFNYPAFSPSSNWVKNNFKLGRRGFVLESYTKNNHSFKPIFIKK